MEPLSKIIDVLFNGRPADAPASTGKQRVVIDLKKLVAKKKVHVTFGGRPYSVTCERASVKERAS